MFRKYGLIGLVMVLFGEIFIFFHSAIGDYLFFALLWYGYILLVDSIVYKLNRKSLLMNERKKFFALVLLSIAFWWVFEFFNLRIKNWHYVNILEPEWLTMSIAFSVVWPAIFESFYLLKSLHLFDKVKMKKRNITRRTILVMEYIGVMMLILIFLRPKYFFSLTWLSVWFIIDPINYLHKKPSIIGYFKEGKLAVPMSLALGSLLTGLFWEFWNYWAPIKWYYDLPFVGSFKIFEMPLLGYLGYLPFGWEVFAMYHFIFTLHEEEERAIKKIRKIEKKIIHK